MSENFLKYAQQYSRNICSLLGFLDWGSVAQLIAEFDDVRNRGSKIFFMGNGGSAATANHFANDLSVCASPETKIPLRAISLASNEALLTCLGNDFGYHSIFVRQLKNLMTPGDVVVGISASGNSRNVIEALEYANSNGGESVALVGFDGGQMRKLAKHVIHVKSEVGEYGPVEDIHMILNHLISTFLAKC